MGVPNKILPERYHIGVDQSMKCFASTKEANLRTCPASVSEVGMVSLNQTSTLVWNKHRYFIKVNEKTYVIGVLRAEIPH